MVANNALEEDMFALKRTKQIVIDLGSHWPKNTRNLCLVFQFTKISSLCLWTVAKRISRNVQSTTFRTLLVRVREDG